MSDYQGTIKYWNQVFGDVDQYDPKEKLSVEKIEVALEWLSANTKNVIDFGCGHGRLLSRLLTCGVERICGMDISEQAISLARQVMKENGLEDRSSFICGGLESLEQIESDYFDGAILSNIIDNMLPEEGERVLKEISRIVKPGGKVFLKLNPYLPPEMLADLEDYTLLEDNLYQESTGVYLWNLSNKQVENIIKDNFKLDRYQELEIEGHSLVSRLYYLINK